MKTSKLLEAITFHFYLQAAADSRSYSACCIPIITPICTSGSYCDPSKLYEFSSHAVTRVVKSSKTILAMNASPNSFRYAWKMSMCVLLQHEQQQHHCSQNYDLWLKIVTMIGRIDDLWYHRRVARCDENTVHACRGQSLHCRRTVHFCLCAEGLQGRC